ncbi:MAG: DNA repair protein RecO [Bacteroidetes bacterium]|nr:MAG: DNA repair protein RecO [Bacteroidota bacterium]
MICKTRGIVLRTVNYSDTSIIVKIYTEEFGVQNYLIKGAKRKNASIKANLFRPLLLLDLAVYKKEKKKLQTLKEVSVEIYFTSIPEDPAKTSILFFLNEILLKCLQEEEKNPELFLFLHESMQTLESAEKNFVNFYLIFLVRFSRHLGFYPQGSFSKTTPYFDLQEGLFMNQEPLHPDFLGKESSKLLSKLIFCNYYSMENLILSGKERKNLLDILLHFYHLHLSNMGSMVSHKVMGQVFA